MGSLRHLALQSNEALQLTAQSAVALWCPFAAFGRYGVN